jgi:hypothetical protein
MYAWTAGGRASNTSGGKDEDVMPPKGLRVRLASGYPRERLLSLEVTPVVRERAVMFAVVVALLDASESLPASVPPTAMPLTATVLPLPAFLLANAALV